MKIARVIFFYAAMGANAFTQENMSDHPTRHVVTTTRLVQFSLTSKINGSRPCNTKTTWR